MNHLLRYSEMISSDLESRPITEKMDHWYLDLKKNLMVNKNASASFSRSFLSSFQTEVDKLRLQFLEEAQQTSLREKQA